MLCGMLRARADEMLTAGDATWLTDDAFLITIAGGKTNVRAFV